MIETYKSFKGYVKIQTIDRLGRIINEMAIDNKITRNGSDFLAKAVYDSKYKISHIYGEYGSDSDYTENIMPSLTTERSDNIDILRESPRNTTDAEAPIVYQSLTASSSDYNNNIITFIASWNNASLNDKIFIGAGLVCKIGTEEILFSHIYYPGKKKRENESIVVMWSVQFKSED